MNHEDLRHTALYGQKHWIDPIGIYHYVQSRGVKYDIYNIPNSMLIPEIWLRKLGEEVRAPSIEDICLN